MTQERYYTYMLRRYKEHMKELREDHTDEKKLSVAIHHYAETHSMSNEQVQNMIQESPAAKQLVIDYYWEKYTL